MTKQELLALIIAQLEEDHRLLMQAATSAHSAATHEDNIPDSKYETLALEASYIAQGQANRAQEIRTALDSFRRLNFSEPAQDKPIGLGDLVLLEDDEGQQRRVFLGPAAGGLKLAFKGNSFMVVTAESPLGSHLLGLKAGETFELSAGKNLREYEILSIE